MYLSLDRNLIGCDEVVRSSSFSACCDGGRGYHSAVLHGDHHCDVIWWSRWLELGRAARDVVDVVRGRHGCSSSSVVGDGVGAVGAAFAAAGVLVVVVGLCVDQAWLLEIDVELYGMRICKHTWPCLLASVSW